MFLKEPTDKKSLLVQLMTWPQMGDSLSYEPMMSQLTEVFLMWDASGLFY